MKADELNRLAMDLLKGLMHAREVLVDSETPASGIASVGFVLVAVDAASCSCSVVSERDHIARVLAQAVSEMLIQKNAESLLRRGRVFS